MHYIANIKMHSTLSGYLLLAHPALRDPNFRRSVVYLVKHSPDEGAFGLVLNRPTGKKVSDFLEHQPVEQDPLLDSLAYYGGPVGQNTLSLTVFSASDTRMVVHCDLDLGEAREMVILGKGNAVGMIGYSGWAAGQLEAELATQSWIVVTPKPAFFPFHPDNDPNRMWFEVMDAMGSAFSLLAREPDEVKWN